MTEAKPERSEQLTAALAGDRAALAGLFNSHRDRLHRMVAARLDDQLAARVNESDVLQDVFVEAQRRIGEFDPQSVPLFIWLRSLTGQRLIELIRFHVGAQKRTAAREIAVSNKRVDASSASLARYFVDKLTTVSQAALREELRDQVRQSLEQLDAVDREIISLRHFEQLTNEETALVLEMNPSTSSTRHLRALKKLRSLLEENPALADYVADFA